MKGPVKETPQLESFLTYRMHRVARLSDRETGTAYAAKFGLNTGEARCLVAIGAFAPLSVIDVALRANQDKGQASRSIRALVERGLVDKHESPGDKRGVVLTLTRKGRTLYVRTMALIAERNASIFGALSATEQRTLGELLDRVADTLRAA